MIADEHQCRTRDARPIQRLIGPKQAAESGRIRFAGQSAIRADAAGARNDRVPRQASASGPTRAPALA